MLRPDSAQTPPESFSETFLQRFLPGSSDAVAKLRADLRRLNSPRNRELVRVVLVLGESGSGKNHLAQVLAGHRRWLEVCNSSTDNPGLEAGLGAYTNLYYAEIHLPNLPDDLSEAELFGCRRGAYTGADKDRPGLLGGPGNSKNELKDVLLDEIGDASPRLQAKLLQVIESGRFRPLGGSPDDFYETSARLILATNRNLQQLSRDGGFRPDLLWRMSQFILEVPPLRSQRDSIERIARSIETEVRMLIPGAQSESEVPRLPMNDLSWARDYEWPGNIRQLKHAITRWYFEDGTSPLCRIVEQYADHEAPNAGGSRSVLDSVVFDALEHARVAGAPAAKTLDSFIRRYEAMLKSAVAAWCRDAALTDEQLQALFRDGKVQSIKNKLYQWRKL
jgi:DNA-binding NtrC family response regulator